MSLTNRTEDEFLTYKALGKSMRKQIKQELKTSKYNHLINPDNKQGVKIATSIDQLADLKCRFSIMPRKEFVKGNGRNTNVGRNEIILSIYGEFKNPENIEEGIELADKYKARIIIGQSFLDKSVEVFTSTKTTTYLPLLREGKYTEFITGMLQTVNDAIETYKNILHTEYMK